MKTLMIIKRSFLCLSLTTTLCASAHADRVNVKTWNSDPALNAKGDGIADDAPNIQLAINSLTSGGTLYIPAGKYKLGATVNTGRYYFTHYALTLTTPNITIRGDGPASLLLQTNCTTTLLFANFWNSSTAGLTIEDIKFQGDTNSDYSAPVDVNDSGEMLVCAGRSRADGWSKYLRIKNVCVDDQGMRWPFQIMGMDDVVVEGCRFIHYAFPNATRGVGYPSIFSSSVGLGSFKLLNNYFDGGVDGTTMSYGADGLVYEQTGEETVISDNIINNYKLEGVQCGARHQTITGNTFKTPSVGSTAMGHCAISITPSSGWTGWGLTNIQLVVANNIQDGGPNYHGYGGRGNLL